MPLQTVASNLDNNETFSHPQNCKNWARGSWGSLGSQQVLRYGRCVVLGFSNIPKRELHSSLVDYGSPNHVFKYFEFCSLIITSFDFRQRHRGDCACGPDWRLPCTFQEGLSSGPETLSGAASLFSRTHRILIAFAARLLQRSKSV